MKEYPLPGEGLTKQPHRGSFVSQYIQQDLRVAERVTFEAGVGLKPRVAPGSLVGRPRLINRLSGNPAASVTVMVAPSGYGKTTLLSQWDSEDTRPFVWVSLDRRHDDPTMLIGAIAAALDKLEPLGDRVFAPLMAPRPNLWNVVVPRLCDALGEGRSPFVLVLDDLHRARDPEALEPLATIAEHMPEGSRLAIASREQPAVPLGRLRTQRGLIEVGARDLAMTDSEAAELLWGVAPGLDAAAVDVLYDSTEGWPAGLYLAGLSLERRESPSDAIERLRGDDRVVSDYLREEFLSSVTAEELDFLTRSSILDRLSGDVCDAVLEREGSDSLLRRLSHANMLLVPLDQRDREYRLHSLLREMLRSELRRTGTQEESALRLRAGEWFAAKGDIDRAIHHLIAAGDFDAAGDLIWASSADYVSTGRESTIRAWLGEFSEAQIVSSPALCLSQATIHLSDGNGAQVERWTGAARDRIRDEAAARPDAEVLMITAMLLRASASAVEGVVQMERDVAGIFDLLPEDSPWRSLCRLVEGTSFQLTGESDRARKALEEGARRGGATAPSLQILCLAQLAVLAIDEGDPDLARGFVDQALFAIEHFGLGEYPTKALPFAVASLVRAQDGRSEDAAQLLRTSSHLLDRLNEISPWYEAEVRILHARTLLLLDDVSGARARLAEGGRCLAKTPDAVVLRNWIEAAWKEADTARAVTGRWPLSPAELRLLHFLPTHLTFREIADEVFVSANTVKTQARAIYRKLGVSSRAEAVTCARAAGLLGTDESSSRAEG